jgi:hypothetical protein
MPGIINFALNGLMVVQNKFTFSECKEIEMEKKNANRNELQVVYIDDVSALNDYIKQYSVIRV